MVDIFVDCVTTIKLIVLTTIVEVHRKRVTIFVVNHVTICIKHNRSRLSQPRTCSATCVCPLFALQVTCSSIGVTILVVPLVLRILFTINILEVTIVVIVVSIHAFKLKTIDTTQGITYLHTRQNFTVVVANISVIRSQNRSIHTGDGIQVLCNVSTEVHAELTNLKYVAS